MEQTKKLNREVVKKHDFPVYMNRTLLEQWGDGIPVFSKHDPGNPEWKATPLIPIDLTSRGLGVVHVKNEADPACNPTKTIKDRAAWELATLYRDYARALYTKLNSGRLNEAALSDMKIPRLSLITAGNEGRAIAECFKRYHLPPPKLIIDRSLPLRWFEDLYADIYRVDLSSEILSPKSIKLLSDNDGGIDLTSIKSFEAHAVFYDWHVHEVFNERPDEIYVPYGSGRLMENYLTWQTRSLRNEVSKERDPRLNADIETIVSIDVFAAEPEESRSVADKLSATFKPFQLFRDKDIAALSMLSFTGSKTGKERIEDDYIIEAHRILKDHHIEAEYSGAAGLALYLKRHENGRGCRGKKVVVVNTGNGLSSI